MWDAIIEFLKTNVGKAINMGIVILIAFVLILIVRLTIGRYAKAKREKKRHASTMAKLIQSILRYIIVIIAIISMIGVWGVDITPILAGAGIVGLAIAFGAQALIRDLLSGFVIVFENYYDLDDVVEIKGFKGRVTNITLKSTRLVNWKGEIKIFSNGDISEITNFSRNPSTGIVEVQVAYEENSNKVISLLEEKLVDMKDLYPQIIEGPNVAGVISLDDSGYTIRVTVKTLPEQHYTVERGIRKHIKELFNEHGVEIPYPHMEVLHGKDQREDV